MVDNQLAASVEKIRQVFFPAGEMMGKPFVGRTLKDGIPK